MSGLNKGIESNVVQDFYRAVVVDNGTLQFNHVEVKNICVVFDSEATHGITMYYNPSDKRLTAGTVVVVLNDNNIPVEKTVIGSFKVLKKYTKELKRIFAQDNIKTLVSLVNKEYLPLGE